jgi:glycosyltransferase involved in cell wall biosynthesis
MNELERAFAFTPTGDDISEVQRLHPDRLPLISVVIPSFNQAAFLPRTLDSVLAQQYPRLEIFVADGGSTDGSAAILEEYRARYPDLLRFESGPDGGQYQGVNKGIAQTSGEIVAWINSDDVYLPGAFWKVAAFFHFNRMAFVVYGKNRYVDRDLVPVTDYPVDWSPLLSEQRWRMMHFCVVPQPSLFFRRSAATLCGTLRSKVLDYELWMRWQRDLPFYFLDDYLSLSRLHDAAITANANSGLLRSICRTVHQYYGVVPLSWAVSYAHTVRHGAAWARGEHPAVDWRERFLARWYWITLNLIWLPRALRMGARACAVWMRQALR